MLFAVDAVGYICVSIYLSGFSSKELENRNLENSKGNKEVNGGRETLRRTYCVLGAGPGLGTLGEKDAWPQDV